MSNREALLDTTAFSEGTWGKGDNGYNMLYGGGLFASYAAHPNTIVKAKGVYSTAAGRYQLLARYYKPYADLLHLPDFSPHSQDAIALQQMRERGALELIDKGCFEKAINACANIWASFPGSPYGQRTQSMKTLKAFYISRGGTCDGGLDEQKKDEPKGAPSAPAASVQADSDVAAPASAAPPPKAQGAA